ncbi:MAG TPA: hypothetical protein VIJ76_05850 [Galbitalea sp.]
MGSNRARGIRLAVSIALAAVLGVGMVGCSPSGAPASPSHTPAAAQPESSRTPKPTPIPELDLAGTAKQNIAYFNKVGHALLDNNSAANTDGRAIVDGFVAAGFPKNDMEITPDKTSVGLVAWNIEFSVKMNGTCLIGQAGNVGFHSIVAPLVSTGTCLIGLTRKIDW